MSGHADACSSCSTDSWDIYTKMEHVSVNSVEEVFKEHGNLNLKWSVLYILTVAGNLRHRIEILGEELPDVALTDEQRRLRIVAKAQNFSH